ncbi:unnamed protein product [Prunus brigantina]
MDSNTTQLLGAPSPPSTSSTNSWTHDVFLSFRGKDTCYNFTDHLHKNLVQKGIRTFIDVPRGEEIVRLQLELLLVCYCLVNKSLLFREYLFVLTSLLPRNRFVKRGLFFHS